MVKMPSDRARDVGCVELMSRVQPVLRLEENM